VVRDRRCRGGEARRRKVALVANTVNIGAVEQVWSLPSVRNVAGNAALALHGAVLIDERTGSFGVAPDTKGVLLDGWPATLHFVSAVRVVTIRALNQSLIHLVVEGRGELRLDIGVALVAEGRLRRFEQGLYLAVVNVVAACATYIARGVIRVVKAPVLCQMALQTLGVHFLCAFIGRIEDFGFVAAFRMCLTRAMAILTSYSVAALHPRRLEMRITGKVLRDLFVAGGAIVGACGILRSRVLLLRRGRFAGCIGLRRGTSKSCGGHHARAHQQKHAKSRQSSENRINRHPRYRSILIHETFPASNDNFAESNWLV
jgi:hypothetical protein